MTGEERRSSWIQDCLTSRRFEYLRGVKLFWRPYRTKSETWTHDHCEFCWDKFTEDQEGTLHEGYTTEDRYYWVCRECYELFKDEYKWEGKDHDESD